jgi:hypothetical protein
MANEEFAFPKKKEFAQEINIQYSITVMLNWSRTFDTVSNLEKKKALEIPRLRACKRSALAARLARPAEVNGPEAYKRA